MRLQSNFLKKLRTAEKYCDWRIKDMQLRSIISLKSDRCAIAEVLLSNCAIADKKKAAHAHL
jgi:hypothetical protein